MTTTDPHAHCGYCGRRYADDAPWPRSCASCGGVRYRNPLPVAVVLLPVDGGLLVVRRAIPPQRGALALPGGFIELHETWQQAAARELVEETGITVAPEQITLFDTLSAMDGHLLVFGRAPAAVRADLPASAVTDETLGWEILDRPATLAFPLHSAVVERFLG